MIGQNRLKEKLKLDISSLPNSVILIGDYGCGKHTFLNELSTNLGIDIRNVSDDIMDNDTFLELQQVANHKIYYVDNIKGNRQNILLKSLEEPSIYTHIFILCESLNGILPTVINRCELWSFDDYSIDELKSVKQLDNELLYSILNTPGKLHNCTENIGSYVKDANNIFDFIDNVIISNVLVLTDKLSYKNENEKLSVNIFADILYNKALEYYYSNKIGFSSLILTNDFKNDLKLFSVDKKKLYERYLIDLKDDIKRYKNGN